MSILPEKISYKTCDFIGLTYNDAIDECEALLKETVEKAYMFVVTHGTLWDDDTEAGWLKKEFLSCFGYKESEI